MNSGVSMSAICGHSLGTVIHSGLANIGRDGGAEVSRTNAPRLLSVKAAADYMGISFWSMRDYIFAGVVPSVKLPSVRANDGRPIRRVLVDRQDLDKLIEHSKEKETV